MELIQLSSGIAILHQKNQKTSYLFINSELHVQTPSHCKWSRLHVLTSEVGYIYSQYTNWL